MQVEQPVSQILLLQIESETRTGRVRLPLSSRVMVGRAAAEANSFELGLDLGPYGGAAQGVSRLHAAFYYEDGAVYVEDLSSTSGTRINGFLLPPRQKYRLRSSDELEFGRVRVTVRFDKSVR